MFSLVFMYCVLFVVWNIYDEKRNWTGVKNGVRMCANILVWLRGFRQNGPNQTSLLVVHHTPTLTSYYVMEFHELTWKKCYSESSHITRVEVKASCTLNRTHVRYIFSCTAVRGPIHKIQSFCTVCIREFMSHSCLIWLQMQK
jgi:hypothetical protein